jgi:hypothetical protein
MVSILVLLIL